MTELTDREASALATGREIRYTPSMLRGMSAARIVELQAEGKLDHLLAVPTTEKPPRENQLRRADLTSMTPEQIVAAQAEGRLDDILEGIDPAIEEPTEEEPAEQAAEKE